MAAKEPIINEEFSITISDFSVLQMIKMITDDQDEVCVRGIEGIKFHKTREVIWVDSDDITNHIKSFEIDKIRIDNLRRSLKRNRDSCHGSLGLTEKQIPLDSLVSFSFDNSSRYLFCKKLKQTICGFLLKSKIEADVHHRNELELYKDIAKKGYKTGVIDILPTDFIKDLKPEYLCFDLCNAFSQKDAEKIILFEWHFARNHAECKADNYDEVLKKKSIYLKKLRDVRNVVADMIKELKDVVTETTERRQIATKRNGITLESCDVKHIPESVDQCIKTNQHGVPITTDCDRRCGKGGLHVFLEKKSEAPLCDEEVDGIKRFVCQQLRKYHETFCCEIVLLKSGCLESEKLSAKKRFLLRDRYYQKKLTTKVVDVIKCEERGTSHSSTNGK